MTDKPPPEVVEAFVSALRGETPAIICPTRCEPCMYGECYDPPKPHPWAGRDDIAHAARTSQPKPAGNCGCSCARQASAEEQLRAQVRAALTRAKISRAEASRQLGVSTKHLNMMLKGHAPLTLPWAERILALCGKRLVIETRRAPKAKP
jgi:hypothetical protein